jgi:recombination protein RecT
MTSTAVSRVEEQRTAILNTVERYSEEIGKLAPKGVDAAHYVASLRLYLSMNPKVMDCTPASIARGILRVAQTGLDLGVSCDLLPFGKECQFNPRYNGIIELALASGVRAINADVVRQGDDFDYQKGTGFFLHHKHGSERGPITHAYACAQIKIGSFAFDVMDRKEIDAVRQKYSKSWKNGSLDEIPWYAKKTVVRRLSPFLPKNARLASALMYSDEVEVNADDTPFQVPAASMEAQEERLIDGPEWQDDSDLVDA